MQLQVITLSDLLLQFLLNPKRHARISVQPFIYTLHPHPLPPLKAIKA